LIRLEWPLINWINNCVFAEFCLSIAGDTAFSGSDAYYQK
jgi:hypothetical protein